MPEAAQYALRADCHRSLAAAPDLGKRLAGQRIAVIGGTGFIGSWLAETVAALNDDLGAQLRIDLFGRSAATWMVSRPHLARSDIALHVLDARSAFELPRDTTMVLFAAGIADPRVHASDPHRVFQTNVYGLDHSLQAAARLETLQRFVNLSSGLVLGNALPQRGLVEGDLGVLDFTRFHNLYAETRRVAESLACVYASQYRIPVSTARAFTFVGPYQQFDAPWALNNFVRDALTCSVIRIHGDGATRRSYLYGSDAAVWLIKLLLAGRDGEVYHLGGTRAVSHGEVADWVAGHTTPSPQIVYKSAPRDAGRRDDFVPDVSRTMRELAVESTFDVPESIERLMLWQARSLNAERRLRTGSA